MIAPVLDELAKEKGEQYLMASVNVADQRDLAVEEGISAVPTFKFYADGELKDTQMGMMSKDAIVEKLQSYEL